MLAIGQIALMVILLALCGCQETSLPPAARVETSGAALRRSRDLAESWNGSLSGKIREPVRTALVKAEEIELISLHPYQRLKDTADPSDCQRTVLGATSIADRDIRTRLLAAFDQGLREFDDDEDVVPDCFNPRHGLRVKYQGKTIYFIICFECNQVVIYIDGKHIADLGFTTGASPQPVFDALLTNANVPLAPKVLTKADLE